MTLGVTFAIIFVEIHVQNIFIPWICLTIRKCLLKVFIGIVKIWTLLNFHTQKGTNGTLLLRLHCPSITRLYVMNRNSKLFFLQTMY